tara:strand:- start:4278 stop:6110 length:1833 start_codon:yes stop_codon:yes gene_type:complete
MASTIQIKRGTGSAVPSGLLDGELALNLDNGKLYYGSGSAVVNSFRFTNLTAENYIVSSSVTNITTQELSGSTVFGNSSDDTHTFTGAITASGDISASGTMQVSDSGYFIGTQVPPVLSLAGPRLRVSCSNDILFDSGDDYIFLSEGTEVVHIRGDESILEVTGQINTTSHITASGNISSSGNILGDFIVSNGVMIGRHNGTTTLLAADTTPTEIQGTNINLDAPITASGDISSSGNIMGDHFIGLDGIRLIENNAGIVTVGFQNNTPIHLGKAFNPITFVSNVTASGNISSSGTIIGEHIFVGTAGSATGHISSSGNILTGFEQSDSSRKVWQFSGTTTGGSISVYNTDSAQIQLSPNTGIFFDSNLVGVSIGTTTSAEPDCLLLAGAGHITASGNISSSGTIIATTASIDVLTGTGGATGLEVTGFVSASSQVLSTTGSFGVLNASNVRSFVELKGDDLYLVSPSSQNRWYGLASNGQSIVNASTVNGVDTSDSSAIRMTSFVTPRNCTVHTITTCFYGIANDADLEFEVVKVPLVDDSTSNVTLSTMTTSSSHNGTFTANKNYVKTFTITGNNTLTAGQGLAFVIRKTSSDSVNLYGQATAEIEITY